MALYARFACIERAFRQLSPQPSFRPYLPSGARPWPTAALFLIGRLGDLLGRRRLLIGGLLLFTLASVACGLASNLPTLIVARAAQGLGAACMAALAMALVGETVAKGKGGAAMGLLGAMSAVGTALGPTLGGALICGIGWPAIYHVNAPLGLAAAVLSYCFLPADARRAEARKGFDYIGTVLLAAMLAAYSLSMTTGRGSFGLVSGALLVAAGSLAGLFVWTESRVRSPLIDVALFRAPGLGAGFFMSACVTTVVMASLVVGPFYLSEALGLDAAAVGGVMSCGPLVAALAGVPAGRIVDQCGAERVTTWGLIVAAAGCAAMASAPQSFGTAGYVVPLAVITAGYAIFQAANNTAVMKSVGVAMSGVKGAVEHRSCTCALGVLLRRLDELARLFRATTPNDPEFLAVQAIVLLEKGLHFGDQVGWQLLR